MALFEGLGQLAAAVLFTSASACDIHIASEAMKDYAAFPAWLQGRGETSALDSIVDALAREIWVGAETRGLTQQALDHHAHSLAKLLTAFPPQAAHLSQALDRGRAGSAAGGASGSEAFARRIAVDIFARARSAGGVAAASLKDDVTLFMIDRVYAHLLDEPKALFRLAPVLTEFLAAKSAPADGSSPANGLAGFGLAETVAAAISGLDAAGGATAAGLG